MNENNIENNNVGNMQNNQPYKAMGNLNTVISNPSANINNTMAVNIASSGDSVISNPQEDIIESKPAVNEEAPTVQENVNPVPGETPKTTFTSDNKPKKRTISLNLGKEFKIALLIIVILLIFIFLLPLLPNFF